MRNKLIAGAALAMSAAAMAAAPTLAQARTERVLVCPNAKKEANKGTAIGAVAGGLLGNVVASKGVKTEGTVLGAGVGAVVGHQVTKKNAKKNCYYKTVRR